MRFLIDDNRFTLAAILLACFVAAYVCGCDMRGQKSSSGNDGQSLAAELESFLPEQWPEGFALADSVRIYGTGEEPARDGTIFDYINGGGVVYIEHGMKTVTHAMLVNDDGVDITIDVYKFNSADNASAAFADEMICPPGFTACDIGESCKTYAYVPDYLIYVLKSRFIVFCSTTDDRIADTVTALAKSVAETIP